MEIGSVLKGKSLFTLKVHILEDTVLLRFLVWQSKNLSTASRHKVKEGTCYGKFFNGMNLLKRIKEEILEMFLKKTTQNSPKRCSHDSLRTISHNCKQKLSFCISGTTKLRLLPIRRLSRFLSPLSLIRDFFFSYN